MSVQIKDRPPATFDIPMFYTQESLAFARALLSDLEDAIKDKALKLTRDAGRDTVTKEDMQRAADEILGSMDVESNGSDTSDA